MPVKKFLKRAFLAFGVLTLALVAAFVFVVGPWPVYETTDYANQPYFADTLARIDDGLALSTLTANPGRLQAGWAERDMTPPVGTPLGGYSGRPNEKRCTAIHDPVHARAIVLSDGEDTVALVGVDLQMVSLNIAQAVWAAVATPTGLDENDILFAASHTHSGPGGFAPGRLGEFTAGAYSPAVEQQIIAAIGEAIVAAHAAMAPARIAHGQIKVPERIKNRTEIEGIDPTLGFLVLEQESGARCYGVRYSAHPTILPETFLEMSAEYPGALCRELAARTGATALFLGGANGAMGPVPPEGATDVERMERMGADLAARIIAYDGPLNYEDHIDIASVGVKVDMPPMQVRPVSTRWRLSPWFAKVAGLPTGGWIQAVQLGHLVLLGMPHDAGGAIAAEWATDARTRGRDLWVSSHCVAYCGYLSPDDYYMRETEGYDQYYEWRLMNWYGPEHEALYRDLKDHILQGLTRSAK